MIHEIIYQLNPNIKRIVEPNLDAYDAEGNQVEYNLDAAKAEVARIKAEEDAAIQATLTAKQSAIDKLKKLGLTEEEALALVSK